MRNHRKTGQMDCLSYKRVMLDDRNMVNRQEYLDKMNQATSLMQEGKITAAGEIYKSLYKMLCLDTYSQRLSLKVFDKIFFGLNLDDVMLLLVNMVEWQLNACETKEALNTIKRYRQIEQDFAIHGQPDYIIDKDEIEGCRRLGDNTKALRLCDELLKKELTHRQKVEVLIKKGSIETEDHHLVFGVNSLSLALAEAEAEGAPALIANCYLEMAAMIGAHYPSLGLSLLWKARIFYERAQQSENVAFCKMRMAMSYFLLWHRGEQKETRFIEEARRLMNDDIKREDFRHPGAKFVFDEQKGQINNDTKLIESAIDFFEGIHAYGDVLRSSESFIKTCLTIGDREGAKRGAKRYEKAAMALHDQVRLDYIRGLDFNHVVASWCPPQEHKDMPNLLDVLERIAFDEEWFHLEKNDMRLLFPTHYQEGMFDTIQMSDGRIRLYPCSLYPSRYYRGQSDRLEGKKCKPSLFRGLSDVEVFHERLCLKELEILLASYPLTKIYEGNLSYNTPDGPLPMFLNVDAAAIGQHYGIKTDMLDLTADKWVAAFFAATKYVDGEYLPYQEDGVGVIYIYHDRPSFLEVFNRVSAVGLQPFSRPGCQAGLVYKMRKDEDFNDKAQRIFFRHDPEISELIYHYCNRSKKLFPDEILEGKVKQIKESKIFTQLALTNTVKKFYSDSTEEEIINYLNNLEITIQDTPSVRFTEDELKAFNNQWEKEKDHFFDSVNIRLAYKGPIEEE